MFSVFGEPIAEISLRFRQIYSELNSDKLAINGEKE